jgi:hypothetical protein
MVKVIESAKLQKIGQEINVQIRNRVGDPKQSVLVGNGIASIDFVNDLDFATAVESEAYGELYIVNDDEALPPASMDGMEIITHKKREFGQVVHIKPSDIQRLTGNQFGGSNSAYFESKTYQEAKNYWVDKARAYNARAASFKIAQCIYGALFGSITNTVKAGGTEDLVFGVTDGGSVSASWATANTDIIADMMAIEDALNALPESQTISNGKTIVSLKVMQAMRRNDKIKALFNNVLNLSALPSNFVSDSSIADFFGGVVQTQETWKNKAKQSVKLFDDNYIIVTPETQIEPIIRVLIAPTQLDPKYVNSDSATGFSVHEYDGLEDPNQDSTKPGSYTAGIRGRIAVFVRNASRIYKKRVIL